MPREEKIEWLLFHDCIEDESEVESLTDEELEKKYKDAEENAGEAAYDRWVTAHMFE